MKKIIIVFALLAVYSCKKDSKINNTFEGDWKTTKLSGGSVNIAAGEKWELNFVKQGETNGKGITTITYITNQVSTSNFTYTIKDKVFSMTTKYVNGFGDSTTQTHTSNIKKVKDNKIVMKLDNSIDWEIERK